MVPNRRHVRVVFVGILIADIEHTVASAPCADGHNPLVIARDHYPQMVLDGDRVTEFAFELKCILSD